MENLNFKGIKIKLGERFSLFLDKNKISPHKLALKIYNKPNNTPNNLKRGKHSPNFELLYLLKYHYPDTDLNWLIFGDLPQAESIISEPVTNYGNGSDSEIMLLENKRLIKEKHLLIEENSDLKNKLLKCYELVISHGLTP